MQGEESSGNLIISTCPRCGTRLICGQVVIGGQQQCPKCKRYWLVEMNHDTVIIRRFQHHAAIIDRL